MSSLNELRRWLADEASESGLTALLRHLPQLSPSPGFADAVVRQLGLTPASRPLTAFWGVRVGLVASLLLTASSFFLLPLVRLAPLPELSDFVSLAVVAVHALATWSMAAISFWDFLFAFAEKATLIFTAPEALLGLALTSVVGLVALGWLLSLTQQHRSSGYAESL